jgi:hypothetical protein
MKKRILTSLLGALLFGITSLAGQSNAPVVEITFSDPDSFTDVRSRRGSDEGDYSWVLVDLSKHLQKLVATYLSEGDHLTVIVTDIDLAGNLEFGHAPGDPRIIRDVYPPLIRLEFKLVDANGLVKAEGSRRLSDRNFLIKISKNRNDPLRYEKELLKKWVKKELS